MSGSSEEQSKSTRGILFPDCFENMEEIQIPKELLNFDCLRTKYPLCGLELTVDEKIWRANQLNNSMEGLKNKK